MSKNNKSANTYGLDEEALRTLGECDVVCHQNRRCHKWVGNVKYQHIINTHREAYLNETRKENKSKLTRSIMQQVKDMGGRFVKYDSEAKAWKEIGAEAQHDKVSHALRATNQARRKRKHANKGAGSDDEASRVSPVPPSSPLPSSPVPPTARFSPMPPAARSPLPQSLPPQIHLPFPLAQQSVLSDQPPLKKIRLQEPTESAEANSQTVVDHAVPLKKRAQSNGLMTPLDINRMMSTGGMAEFARLWESMSQPGNGPLNQPVTQGPIAQAVSYTEPEDLAPLDMLRTRTASIGVWAAVADALAAEQKQQQQQEPKRESESDKDTQDTASQATPISDLKPLERLRTISANVWATLAQEAGLSGLGFSDDNEKKEAPQEDEKEASTDPTSADDEKKQATRNGETQASLAGTGTTGAAGAGLRPLERLRTISESVWATLAQEAGLDFVTPNDDNEKKQSPKNNGTLEPLDMLRLRTISMAALGPPSRAAVAATAAAMAEPSMAPPPSRPGANAFRSHSDEAAAIAPKSDFVQSWLKMSSPSSSNNDALSNNNTSTKQS